MNTLRMFLTAKAVTWILFVCIMSVTNVHANAIPVWTYHAFPPFIINEQTETGLSYDLAALLTAKSEGKHQFKVEVLPRNRLDENLSSDDQGIVFWVNKAWFGDMDETKYLWSSALLSDSNSVISRSSNPVSYESADSLVGMSLVGVRGHHYKDMDELVKQNKVIRLNVSSEEAAIRFIASGRADVTIQSHSSAKYFANSLDLENKLHFSENPQSRYNRHILVQPQLQEVYKYIENFVTNLPANTKWNKLLEKYELSLEN